MRDKFGRFLKGTLPITPFKKGIPSWNAGIKQWDTRPHPRGMLGKLSSRKNPIKRNCLNCFKEFYSILSKVKKGGAKFCSRKCFVEFNRGKNSPLYGKHRTIETKRKLSISHSGERCHFWKGGITPINQKIRVSLEYKLWRKMVYERDNYTCVICKKRGKRLNADHIKPFALYPKLRFELNNGRTLCEECHKKTDTYAKRFDFFGLELPRKEAKIKERYKVEDEENLSLE